MPKSTKILLTVIVVLIAAGILWYIGIGKKSVTAPTTGENSTSSATTTSPVTPAPRPGAYVPPSGSLKTFTDSDYSKATRKAVSYSLQYPRDFDVRTGDQAGGGNWLPGQARVSISFPADAYKAQKTNFAGGSVIATVDVGVGSIDACLNASQDPQLRFDRTETLNGIVFHLANAGGAGAGNFYDSHLYRAVYGGNCYELVAQLHTTNVGNYEPGTVTEFDATQAWPILEGIVRSVAFSTETR